MQLEDKISVRQNELLDLAMVLIQEKGMAGLTVRRLADRAGFSEAALYRHFASKQALLRAVAQRMAGKILGAIGDLQAREDLRPDEKIVLLLQEQITTILRVRGLPVLLLAEGSNSGDEELLEVLRRGIERFISTVASWVEEARSGALDDTSPEAREVAHLLFGLGTATAIRHRLRPDPDLEKAAVETLPRFLVDRLLASTSPEKDD